MADKPHLNEPYDNKHLKHNPQIEAATSAFPRIYIDFNEPSLSLIRTNLKNISYEQASHYRYLHVKFFSNSRSLSSFYLLRVLFSRSLARYKEMTSCSIRALFRQGKFVGSEFLNIISGNLIIDISL